ncbi:phage major capsid protein [Victivallaceae bacterium BBE-744-WT-12]|uniref:Phage major capsid protein n=1 Tax=Victivallis lenta TaxID=2606640 RepID=A0A844G5I7_9BACT|nr:phage major capsid protein [Victivallis lenta]MST97609.1 phage major capsid protein [Victivallis lenta]
MKLTKEVRDMLIAAGMDKNASDEEARQFAADNGIKIVDCRGTQETDMTRAIDLLALGRQRGMFDEVSKMLRDGKSNEEIYTALLERSGAKPAGTAEIGLTDKDKRQYSICRAIHAAASQNWDLAPFEREVSEAAAKHMKMESRGFFVPMDILSHNSGARIEHVMDVRASDLTAGTAANGGNTVATELLMGDFIDMLRKRLVLSRLGVRYLTGLRGSIAIPKQTAGAASYFVAEDGNITGSGQKFAQIAMSPKTVGAMTSFSRLLTIQSSLAVEQFVRADLAMALAEGIETAALNGTGTDNQPLGLLKRTGTNVVAIGTNGGALTWKDVVAMETEVADDNVFDDGTMAYLFNARTRGALKTTEKFANTGKEIYQPGMNRGEGEVNGYLAAVSNILPKNGTKGTGTGLSTGVFGRWSDQIIGLWGVLDLLVDPYSSAQNGGARVVALQSFDTTVRYEESFCLCSDIVTA